MVNEAYRGFISQLWSAMAQYSNEYRASVIMNKNFKVDLIQNYISYLVRLWIEMENDMKGRTDIDKSFRDTFESYEKYCKNPRMLFDKAKEDYENEAEDDTLTQVERVIREAMSKLKLTE